MNTQVPESGPSDMRQILAALLRIEALLDSQLRQAAGVTVRNGSLAGTKAGRSKR